MDITLDYAPQPRQALLHNTPARQILYGGAVGGGKSHGLRWDAYDFCLGNPGCQAYLFRRSYTELRDNHIMHVRYEIPEALATYAETRNNLEFQNGSVLHFRYCEKEADVFRYQGTEMHWCGIDEAGQFTDSQINYLKSRNRLGGWKPQRDRGRLPRFALASNPGGPGHNFLKAIFVDGAPPETLFHDRTMKNPENENDKGWLSIYIPARIADNKYIDANYAGALGGLPPEMAKAYREGDWDAVVGKAIWNLDRNAHQLRAFTPPKHWTHFQAIDWGTAAPFSVGWYTVSEGAELKASQNWPAMWLPSGAIIRYNEWYGWDGRPNHGMRLVPQAVAKRIREMEAERKEVMDYRIGDTEMWASKGGPSASEWFRKENVILRQAKKDRKRNYLEILARLAGNEEFLKGSKIKTEPMLFVTVNCTHFWRTVPTLTLDDVDPEKGPADNLENHCLGGDTIVRTPNGEFRIDELPFADQGLIWASDGWRPFVNLGKTADDAEVCLLETTDGRRVKATPSHRFLCADGRYRRLDELTYNDYLVSVPFKKETGWLNSSTVKRIGFVVDTIRGAASAFIGWFGNTLTDLFPSDTTFITKTAIGPTTTLPTWNYCRRRFTSRSTSARQNVELTRKCISSASDHLLASGTARKMEESGTPSTEGKLALFRQGSRSSASSVERAGWQNTERGNSVRPPVSKRSFAVGIRAITRLSKRESVYDLHVPMVNNFTVSGGIVVHNCYDELAYACRSRPFITTEEQRYMAEWGEEIDKARGKSVDPYATV